MPRQYTPEAIQAIDIHFENLSYEVQIGYRGPKKQILKGLNGIFKCGELTAIMGPSGAGKSSFLNILTGFQEENVRGTVDCINRQGKLNRNKCKKVSCYIQQTDSLYGMFTVQESMMTASCLKIANITQKLRQILIDDILNMLNLAKAKDTRITQLSGGQKKRLSIALELIDNPPIMFLDEPTTGLDSLASLQCISVLQTLAKSGRTIICTIHQPSAALYHMFDYVYLLVDGHCMYAGASNNTVNYFAKQGLQCPRYHNPADYMLEVASQEHGDHNDRLITAAKKHCQRDQTPVRNFLKAQLSFASNKEGTTLNPPSEMMRFQILLRRYVLLMYRDRTTTQIKILFHLLVGVLLGLLYENAGNDSSKTISNIGFQLVTIIYLGYTSTMPAVLKFPLEIDILKKERFNNWYQLKTYYITTLVTSIPLQMLVNFLYLSVSYVLSNQPMEWFRYYRFLIIIILTSITSESFGINCGTIFNPINGTFVGAITIAAMTVLSGFLILLSHMPVILYYISYINYFRYAFDGLIQALYGYHRDKLNCPSSVEYCHYRIPSKILKELSMDKSMFWIDVLMLFIYFVILRITAYKLLQRKLKKL